jgi:hypothetical protein
MANTRILEVADLFKFRMILLVQLNYIKKSRLLKTGI